MFIYQVDKSQAKVGTEQTGNTDATNAKSIATSLNVPAGSNIAIYADLEYTQPDARWLTGWVNGIKASPSFMPGIYSGISALRDLFGPFPAKIGTPNKLDPFFTQANQSNPFQWWITNPIFQGPTPTPPKFVAKDKPFDLTAFDLLNALNVDKKGTKASMDLRLQNLIVLWQYATNWDSAPNCTFVKPPARRVDKNGNAIGQVDLNLSSTAGYDSMFLPV